MITAVIVDDETRARDTIISMLSIYCNKIKVIGQAWDVESAFKLINDIKPEVVFLDIQMPDGSGFDLLKRFQNIFFKFVIITAFQDYAIRAFKFSAIDFILKPIDPTDLINAVEKLSETIREEEMNHKFKTFIENIQQPDQPPKKLLLKTIESVIVADTESIIRCESQSNYTLFHFSNRPKLIVSRTLKEFEEILSSSGFIRTHQSHLVNIKYITSFTSQPESFVTLTDGNTIPVAVRKRETVEETISRNKKR
jgi:two-component system LytT family response regulator